MGFALMPFLLAYGQAVPSLAQVELTLEKTQQLPLSNKITFEFETNNSTNIIQALKHWDNISVEQLTEGQLSISMIARPQFSGTVTKQNLQSSFVIDLDEDSTESFVAGFSEKKQLTIELNMLAAYVNRYIENPTYIHGFNIASKVASQRSGDCTEYAVLVTTLARSLGLPARIVLGTVILEEKRQVSAFGHAWTEIWFSDQWNVVDAALHQSSAAQLFYLPATPLINEGPGFTFSLIEGVKNTPHSIKNLRNF